MKKMILLLGLLLLLGTVFSQGLNVSEAKAEKSYCEANFAISNANSVIEQIPSSEAILNEKLSKVNTALTDLNSTVSLIVDQNSNKMLEFQVNSKVMAVSQALVLLNQETKNQIRTTIKDFNQRKNVMDALKVDFEAQKTIFLACKEVAVSNMVNARLTAYNIIIANWQEKINRFSDKNMNVTEMQTILDGAKTQIIEPITQALLGSDLNAKLNAAKGYCLFNGCSIVNYHLAARMEVAKFEAIITMIKAKTTDANILAQADSASADLDATKVELAKKQTEYTIQSEANVWKSINSAAAKLRKTIRVSQGGN